MFVGLSPFLSVLFLEVTPNIFVYLLFPISSAFLLGSFFRPPAYISSNLFSVRAYRSCTCPTACQVPTENSSTLHLSCSRIRNRPPTFFRLPSYFIKLVPHCGKESSLLVPSFTFFLSPHPCCPLSTLADVTYLCIGFFPMSNL